MDVSQDVVVGTNIVKVSVASEKETQDLVKVTPSLEDDALPHLAARPKYS
jgi:hypothetical protein